MNNMVSMVIKAHPGTQVYNIDGFDQLDSLRNMWAQVDWFKKQMLPIFKNSTDGVHMICYSQGNNIPKINIPGIIIKIPAPFESHKSKSCDPETVWGFA